MSLVKKRENHHLKALIKRHQVSKAGDRFLDELRAETGQVNAVLVAAIIDQAAEAARVYGATGAAARLARWLP
ncbi:MAG: hypothetical protein GY911_11855 [Actinomycetales bacterium]|nr:hypothetical protein [Actinomycetales bacterium]